MDCKEYEVLRDLVEEIDPGLSINPVPEEGEDVSHFDVVSDEARISPQKVMNAIRREEDLAHPDNFILRAAQKYCISLEDLNAR